MGVYIYCTKPSHTATAIIERAGVLSTETVALYRYAYKPTFSFDAAKWNQRWRFSSGAAACAAAFARSGKEVSKFGVFFDDEANEVYAAGRRDANGVFLTGGDPEVYDDHVRVTGKVVRWIKLPKGVKEGALPKPQLDERLTPTTVLQYTPRALSECQGTLNYWTRLADPATGEAQPEWTLVYSAEALLERAAKFGVSLAKAPEGAL